MVKDKIHFFVQPRARDRGPGATIKIPSRPDLNAARCADRVWNTIIRFDHQVNNATTAGASAG